MIANTEALLLSNSMPVINTRLLHSYYHIEIITTDTTFLTPFTLRPTAVWGKGSLLQISPSEQYYCADLSEAHDWDNCY